MAVYLFFGFILLAAVFAVCKTGQRKKRGCGRGCATCGSRFICHPKDYDKPPEA